MLLTTDPWLGHKGQQKPNISHDPPLCNYALHDNLSCLSSPQLSCLSSSTLLSLPRLSCLSSSKLSCLFSPQLSCLSPSTLLSLFPTTFLSLPINSLVSLPHNFLVSPPQLSCLWSLRYEKSRTCYHPAPVSRPTLLILRINPKISTCAVPWAVL